MEEKKEKCNENSENAASVITKEERVTTSVSVEATPLVTVNGNESRIIKSAAKKDHKVQPLLTLPSVPAFPKPMECTTSSANVMKSLPQFLHKPQAPKDLASKPMPQHVHVMNPCLPNASSTPKPRFVAVIVQPVVSSSPSTASTSEKVSLVDSTHVQKAVVVRPILTSSNIKPQISTGVVKDKGVITPSLHGVQARTMVSLMNTGSGVERRPMLAPSLNNKKHNGKVNAASKTNGGPAHIKFSPKTESNSVGKLPELYNTSSINNSSGIAMNSNSQLLKGQSDLKPAVPLLKLGLSKSFDSSQLSKALNNKSKINLSKSCFGAIRTEKGPPDDDLTSLKWLQKNDILKTLDVSQTVGSVSPPHEPEADIIKAPFGAVNDMRGDGFETSPGCSSRQNSPSKPPYSFSSLIFMAIEDSASKKLPVKDIYNWITDHFPYYRHAQSGWKNSVRHNLSLNKCFKKVDKERGQHGIGKGSLWCVDASFRPNLLQALRKTQPFQPYPQFSTPPPSPHNGEPLSSSTPIKGGHNSRKSVIQDGARTSTPDIDPELEAEAAATMCMIGTPPELRALQGKNIQGTRSQSCPLISDEKPNSTYTGHHQRHRGSFSGPISSAPTEKRKRNKNERAATTGSINIKRLKQELNSSSLGKPSSLSYSTDGEFEFDGDVESESEDDYTDDELLNELSDSGFGQTPKSTNKNKLRKYSESDDKLGADALLQLATSACYMQPIRGSPVNGVESPNTC